MIRSVKDKGRWIEFSRREDDLMSIKTWIPDSSKGEDARMESTFSWPGANPRELLSMILELYPEYAEGAGISMDISDDKLDERIIQALRRLRDDDEGLAQLIDNYQEPEEE